MAGKTPAVVVRVPNRTAEKAAPPVADGYPNTGRFPLAIVGELPLAPSGIGGQQ